MALGLGGWAKMYFSRLVPTMGCFFFTLLFLFTFLVLELMYLKIVSSHQEWR